MNTEKGQSPFYPSHPVPVELFVGRAPQIDRIMKRAVAQVASGKSCAVYVQGEYGIGKSSVARYVRWKAERDYGLLGIHAVLGGGSDLTDVPKSILEATILAGAYDVKVSEKIRDWVGRYVGEQSLFGFALHTDELLRKEPDIARGILPFLRETYARVKEDGIKGIVLILDELNGITANPQFPHLIKSLVDSNALDREPVPLLLMLCGVADRRADMIRHYQPVERIFDVVEIGKLSQQEMEEFFARAFSTVRMTVDEVAMQWLTYYSAGLPKIMHLIGDSAFWLDSDGSISPDDALKAVVDAADEVGKKYVDQQVYAALRSTDYHSILGKISRTVFRDDSFHRAEIAKGLTPTELNKFDAFLLKMTKLNVLRHGSLRGEYIFNVRMAAVYIWLKSESDSNAHH